MDERPKGCRDTGLSPEEAAKMLGVSASRVAILAGQGRLKARGETDETRYDLDSVLSMQAEDLIREMLEEAGDENPKLREKVETLAAVQYQRGREASQRAEHWEMLERIEKADKKIEAQLAEMHAMEEGQLCRMSPKEGERETG
jgi:predicted transcriptional regulator